MKKLVVAFVGFVALQHIGFLILEMFLWTSPVGLRTFGLDPDFAAQSSSLAANQGLYNGFLATGLIWSLMTNDRAYSLQVFFLSCVIVAGVFGAATAKGSILLVQGVPAMVALLLVWIHQKRERAK